MTTTAAMQIPVVIGDGRLIHAWADGDVDSDEEPGTTACGRRGMLFCATVRDQVTIEHCPRCPALPIVTFCVACSVFHELNAAEIADTRASSIFVCASCRPPDDWPPSPPPESLQ